VTQWSKINVIIKSIIAVTLAFYFSMGASTAIGGPINLITNGGFETGALSGWSAPAVNPNPWSVVSDNAHSGTFSAFNPALDSAIAAPTMFQFFSPVLVENITSAFFWYYDGGNRGTVGKAALLTFSDGTSVQDTLFADDPSYRLHAWTLRDLTPTLLPYSGKYLTGIGFFPKGAEVQYIDDVTITSVPEPASIGLLAVGLLAVVLRGLESSRSRWA
jgi:PEP-CTERM motif